MYTYIYIYMYVCVCTSVGHARDMHFEDVPFLVKNIWAAVGLGGASGSVYA